MGSLEEKKKGESGAYITNEASAKNMLDEKEKEQEDRWRRGRRNQ